MLIYLVTNLVNGKQYVGQTHYGHLDRFRGHCVSNSPLGRAIRHFGVDNFSVKVLKECTSKEDLDKYELFYTNKYDSIHPNGYNLRAGGSHGLHSSLVKKKMSKNHADVVGKNNPMFGKNHTEHTKNKISKSKIGKKQSVETRDKRSKALMGNCNALGNKLSREARERISNSLIGNKYRLGHKHSASTRRKMSIARMGRTPFLGKSHSLESRNKISASLRKHYRGG